MEAIAHANDAVSERVVVLGCVIKELVFALERLDLEVGVRSLGPVQFFESWFNRIDILLLQVDKRLEIALHHRCGLVPGLGTNNSNDWHFDGRQLEAVCLKAV